MKILDTSSISSSVAMPVKSGTLQFIQDAHKEALNGLIKNIIESPITDTVYILSGCVNSLTSPNYNISTGVLYVNGEVFDFDGAIFATSGLQKAYARIETTQYVTNADPVQFTDGVNRNVHNIRKIVIENTITSSGLPEFKDFVYAGKYFKGETKEIVMDSVEYGIKFSGTGLGLLEYIGWAEMNGNNGTVNDNGNVVIAHGSSFPTLGATGGASTNTIIKANLPPISIPLKVTDGTSNDAGTLNCNFDLNTNDSFGSSTPVNNMQPYVVRLRIQKI